MVKSRFFLTKKTVAIPRGSLYHAGVADQSKSAFGIGLREPRRQSKSALGIGLREPRRLAEAPQRGAPNMQDREPGLFRKWFWNTYDYLGTLIVINILWLLLALPLVTLPLAFAGLFRVTGRIAAYEETGIRDFFAHTRGDLGRSFKVCVLYAGVLILLAANMFFYMRLMEDWPWAGAILSGVMMWLIVFVCMTAVYALPLMLRRQAPARQIIRSGVFLVLDNPRRSFLLFLGGSLVMAFSLASGIGLLFLGLGAIGVLFSTGLREILKRYEQKEAGVLEEARGWRDLIRPWGYS